MKTTFCDFKLWAIIFTAGCMDTLFAADTEGMVELGAAFLSDDAYRYGNIVGTNDEGLAPIMDFSLQASPLPASGNTTYWKLQGQRLGLDTGRLALDAGQQGSQRIRLDYRENSTYYFDDVRTPMLGAGSTTLSLPQGWQVDGSTTDGMTTLHENLVDINQGLQRKSLTLDYRRKLNPRWSLNVDFQRNLLDGSRTLAGATGSNGGNVRALLLPAPLDYQTQVATLSLAYTGPALRWNMGYQGSFFYNDSDSLIWPTTFGQHPRWAPNVGYPNGLNQLALEPNNQAHRLSMNGSVVLSRNNRLYLDASLGRQSQNDLFLPFTINPGLTVNAPLPRDSLDGKVDTSRLNLRLTSRAMSRLNLVSRVSYRRRDNQTPIAAYQRVPGDAVDQQSYLDARLNRPYSFTESRASSEAVYRVSSSLRLEAGYEYTNTERDYSEVKEMDEHSVRMGVRSTGFDSVVLALDYRHQRRRTDDYVGNRPLISTHVPGSIDAEDFENHPLLRKYYLNARDRDQFRIYADWYLLSNLSLGAALNHNKDDYPSGYFGLNESTMRSATLDVTYTQDENFRVSGFINQDRYHYDQSGRSFRGSVPADAFNPQRDWQVRMTDLFDTVGISFDREQIRPRLGAWQAAGTLDMSLSLSHSRSRGDLSNSVASALTSAPLPELSTRLTSATLSASYSWSMRSSLRFSLTHERYRSADFALDNIAPATTASVLLLGQDSPQYQVTWTSLSYRFQF